jgi:hypothetical protein
VILFVGDAQLYQRESRLHYVASSQGTVPNVASGKKIIAAPGWSFAAVHASGSVKGFG